MEGIQWALLGGSIAAAGGAIGSAIGVARASQTGTGVLSEEPDKFGSVLILTVLPGTQGFYGFITAMLVWVFFNLAGAPKIPVGTGLNVFAACIVVALGECFSAIAQGWASQAAIQFIARRGEQIGKAVIFPALVETYAVTSLVIGIFYLLAARASL